MEPKKMNPEQNIKEINSQISDLEEELERLKSVRDELTEKGKHHKEIIDEAVEIFRGLYIARLKEMEDTYWKGREFSCWMKYYYIKKITNVDEIDTAVEKTIAELDEDVCNCTVDECIDILIDKFWHNCPYLSFKGLTFYKNNTASIGSDVRGHEMTFSTVGSIDMLTLLYKYEDMGKMTKEEFDTEYRNIMETISEAYKN